MPEEKTPYIPPFDSFELKFIETEPFIPDPFYYVLVIIEPNGNPVPGVYRSYDEAVQAAIGYARKSWPDDLAHLIPQDDNEMLKEYYKSGSWFHIQDCRIGDEPKKLTQVPIGKDTQKE